MSHTYRHRSSGLKYNEKHTRYKKKGRKTVRIKDWRFDRRVTGYKYTRKEKKVARKFHYKRYRLSSRYFTRVDHIRIVKPTKTCGWLSW